MKIHTVLICTCITIKRNRQLNDILYCMNDSGQSIVNLEHRTVQLYMMKVMMVNRKMVLESSQAILSEYT